MKKQQLKQQEQGSFMLFVAAFLLPAFFFAFSLINDLSGYYLASQKIQNLIDEAGIQAFRMLPDVKGAEVAARNFVAREMPAYVGKLNISSGGDGVSLSVSDGFQLSFARFFNLDLKIPYSAVSRVRGTSIESMIVVDLSKYLAPSIIDKDSSWGSADQWGAARYFTDLNPTPGYSDSALARLLTQQCFNPLFSKVKEVAIQTYNLFSQFELDGVGLATMPGVLTSINPVRRVLPIGIPENASGGEINVELYSSYYLQGEAPCAAAAENENQYSHYNFPVVNDKANRPIPMIIPNFWIMDPAYQEYMTGQEYIWMQSVNEARMHEIEVALDTVEAQLLGAVENKNLGGLSDRVIKAGVIVLGDLPWSQEKRFPDPVVENVLRDRLARILADTQQAQARMRIYFIVLRQFENDPQLVNQLTQFQRLVEEFSSVDEEGIGLLIRAFSSASTAEVSNSLATLVALDKRRAILSR